MVEEYIFSGSLPEKANTYVTREADTQLYKGLKAGKFCYVLNSRQSGKSSLRVQTMQRLKEDGVKCAAIDLSAGGIQNVPPEQWYADLIDTLIDIFDLDVDFGDWWEANQLNSLVTRFRKFIEGVLLAEIQENIVIFIDEIDSVLSLKFPTDDFFAFIRSCYNHRVDNSNYNRLTFCLLGVASPNNLIKDKKRTPFNIGESIILRGFQLHEVEPLEKGLQERYPDSHRIMKNILDWTGGQPFLTQKLCQFMVEESLQYNPRTVEEVVRSRIIENWESQDEPEHFRTIRDRIIKHEEYAGFLLELYQQIQGVKEKFEIIADDTIEQSELQLSGLVVRQQNKLRVYNAIYREIFDQYWVETELRKLRPYSENFRFWVASDGKDESRLLRGKALQDALQWVKNKSLNFQEKEFLAASQAKEKEEAIAALEKESQLERERKDREAAEERNQVLIAANQEAQHIVRIGSIVLSLTFCLTVILAIIAVHSGREVIEAQKKIQEINRYIVDDEKFSQEVKEQLKINSSSKLLREISRLIDLSKQIKDLKLRQSLLHSCKSLFNLNSEKEKEAGEHIDTSLKYLAASEIENKEQGYISVQEIKVLAWKIQGDILVKQKEQLWNDDAIEAYDKTYDAFQIYMNQGNGFQQKSYKIINSEMLDSIYNQLIDLSSNVKNNKILLKEKNKTLLKTLLEKYKILLKKTYLSELEYLMKINDWQSADQKNTKIILLLIAFNKNLKIELDRTSINSLTNKFESDISDIDSNNTDIKKLYCQDIASINLLWLRYSQKRSGFSLKESNSKNKINKDTEYYNVFKKQLEWSKEHDISDPKYFIFDINSTPIGYLPSLIYPLGKEETVGKVFFGELYWGRKYILSTVNINYYDSDTNDSDRKEKTVNFFTACIEENREHPNVDKINVALSDRIN